MGQPFVRTRATWLGYVMLAFFGYFIDILGPITPFLKTELNISYTVSSFHFSAFALGLIVGGLLAHRVVERVGRWNALWIGAFGMSISSLILVAGRVPALTIGACFSMGLIGSLVLTSVTAFLSDQHGETRAVAYAEANVMASVIGAIAPLLVGSLAPTVLGWRAGLVLGAASALVSYFGFGKIQLASAPVGGEVGGKERPLSPLYWVYWAAMVLSVSVEFCMVFWSASYLQTSLLMPEAQAAQAVSLFLVGMIIGRVGGSRAVRRYSGTQVVAVSLLIAFVGFLIYWTALTPLVGVAGLLITGVGVASLYPVTLSLGFSVSGGAVRAGALSSLASGVAIFSLPLLLGGLADKMGIRAAYGVVIILLVANLVLTQSAARVVSPKKTVEASAS